MIFGGIIGARAGVTALPVAFRDVFVVLPLYVAFGASRAGRDALRRLPAGLALGLGAVLFWIVISLFNPEGVSGFQLLIGLKVWVFYLPFVLVGFAVAARPDAMFRTFRILVMCGVVACSIGLLQAALIRMVGYHPTMTLFFGGAASDVTQRFAEFAEGGGIYRIPATFSFAGQYVAFLFLFLTAAAIESNADPDLRYQRLGRIAFYIGILAGLFSGTKAAFLVFPALAAVFFAFGLIRSRLAIGAPIAFAVAAWAIEAAKLNPLGLLSFGVRQAQDYGQGFVLEQISAAVRYGPFGQGIGSSTGAARFAAMGSEVVTRLGFESYYAKVAAELGTVGLTIFTVFFMGIVVKTIQAAISHRRRRENILIAPLAIYIILNLVYSFKGFVLDTDPGNVFFWLFLGVMIRLDRGVEVHVARDPDQAIAPDENPIPITQIP